MMGLPWTSRQDTTPPPPPAPPNTTCRPYPLPPIRHAFSPYAWRQHTAHYTRTPHRTCLCTARIRLYTPRALLPHCCTARICHTARLTRVPHYRCRTPTPCTAPFTTRCLPPHRIRDACLAITRLVAPPRAPPPLNRHHHPTTTALPPMPLPGKRWRAAHTCPHWRKGVRPVVAGGRQFPWVLTTTLPAVYYRACRPIDILNGRLMACGC